MATKAKFDPTEHLISLKGKDYLQVQHRVMWFKDTHPKGQILTEVVSLDPVVMKATITDDSGNVIATGHGSAQPRANAVWSGRELEKAETAAVGRALGLAGFGTQFTSDFADGEDDYLADSPQAPKTSQNSPQKRETTPNKPNTHNGAKNGAQTANQPVFKDATLTPYVTVKPKPDGTFFMELKTVDLETVYCFNWHVFEDTAWCDKEEWRGKEGSYTLPAAPTAKLKQQPGKPGHDPYWVVEWVDKYEVTF